MTYDLTLVGCLILSMPMPVVMLPLRNSMSLWDGFTFNEVELREFIRRMNEMAGLLLSLETGTVSRPVLVK